MCLLNYNKKSNKYKHITYSERTMIERWHNKERLSKREIANRLNKSERTIRREIKKGMTINLTSNYEEIWIYVKFLDTFLWTYLNLFQFSLLVKNFLGIKLNIMLHLWKLNNYYIFDLV